MRLFKSVIQISESLFSIGLEKDQHKKEIKQKRSKKNVLVICIFRSFLMDELFLTFAITIPFKGNRFLKCQKMVDKCIAQLPQPWQRG